MDHFWHFYACTSMLVIYGTFLFYKKKNFENIFEKMVSDENHFSVFITAVHFQPITWEPLSEFNWNLLYMLTMGSSLLYHIWSTVPPDRHFGTLWHMQKPHISLILNRSHWYFSVCLVFIYLNLFFYKNELNLQE